MKLMHEDASPGALRLVRILVFATWFLRVVFKPLHKLAYIPDSLYEPVGILALLPSSVEHLLRTTAFLHGLKAAALVSFLVVIAGLWRPWSMVGASVLMTLFAMLWRGFAGHIDHESILILFAGYLLTLFELADRRAERTGARIAPGGPTQAGIPLTAIMAVLLIVYMNVAIFRLVHGFPEIFTSNSLTFWALRNNYETARPVIGLGKYVIEYPWMGKMLDGGFPVITLIELTSLLALISKEYRWIFLAMMVPFHVLSLFTLDVFFWENMVLYVLFFSLAAVGVRKTRTATPATA